MEAIGLLVALEARAGKEADAEAFLKSAQPLALNEKATLKWYAIRINPFSSRAMARHLAGSLFAHKVRQAINGGIDDFPNSRSR